MEQLSKLKIIIIDKGKDGKKVLTKMLIDHNCEVDAVSSEKKAIDRIISNYYDFYFVNISISGLYLINLIKKTKEKSKIIAISSDPDVDTEGEIREAGITYFLKKPYLKKEVMQLIDNLCN